MPWRPQTSQWVRAPTGLHVTDALSCLVPLPTSSSCFPELPPNKPDPCVRACFWAQALTPVAMWPSSFWPSQLDSDTQRLSADQVLHCTEASELVIWGHRHLLLLVEQQADWAHSKLSLRLLGLCASPDTSAPERAALWPCFWGVSTECLQRKVERKGNFGLAGSSCTGAGLSYNQGHLRDTNSLCMAAAASFPGWKDLFLHVKG